MSFNSTGMLEHNFQPPLPIQPNLTQMPSPASSDGTFHVPCPPSLYASLALASALLKHLTLCVQLQTPIWAQLKSTRLPAPLRLIFTAPILPSSSFLPPRLKKEKTLVCLSSSEHSCFGPLASELHGARAREAGETALPIISRISSFKLYPHAFPWSLQTLSAAEQSSYTVQIHHALCKIPHSAMKLASMLMLLFPSRRGEDSSLYLEASLACNTPSSTYNPMELNAWWLCAVYSLG